MKPHYVLLWFLLLSALLFAWGYILRAVWTKPSRLRSLLIKVSVSASSIAYLFLALELLFYTFYAASETINTTLASRLWLERYWHPVNSLGYRDVEHGPADFENKEVIFVVGDSFVAGYGIRRIEDRFSDILRVNLGGRYEVVNIAKNGWDTADEYHAILSYPRKPKRIILSYYINDILGAAQRSGYGYPVRVVFPRTEIKWFLNRSYVLNFVYWRLYRLYNHDMGKNYWDFLEKSYSSRDIWQAHEAELLNIVSYAQNEGIALTVVVFPDLTEVRGSAAYTAKVTEFFRRHDVRVFDLAPLLDGRDPRGQVVSSQDSHPNEALNKEVAEILTREIEAQAAAQNCDSKRAP